jgi:glycosyltransferase involved in cell wall biosynthesis
MSESLPKVTVIVPAYNGERTILRTISSIIGQKQILFDLIVIDDSSKDSTVHIVDDFMKSLNFSGEFCLIRHEKNLGLSKSLNDGIQRARGQYILILHQDCEFVGDDWISRSLSIMADERVAVVTGYYGVTDVEDETFIKRAFGVLRGQFHSRPEVLCEEATFSEGKCDMYRKDLLLKIGNFPTSYRIAGEDLIVSYRLRSMGYKIIKCFDLAVVQRFTGSAESFGGNLRKEFLFGKVMGGVFSEFKFYLFKGVTNSKYSGSRSINRATQPIFVLSVAIFLISAFIWPKLAFILLGLFFVRLLFHFYRVSKELKKYKNYVKHRFINSIAIGFIGILTDFAYSFGFAYGSIIHRLKRKL